MIARALLVLCLLAAPLAADETYDVKLQVLYGGQPIHRALVTLKIDGAVVADDDSNEDGWVTFTGLAVERFEVLVKKAGYFDRRSVWYNFTRQDIVSAVPLKKRVKWALSGSVRGRGPDGVALLPGARVSLLIGADAEQETQTGADGTFSFRELYDTECRFVVAAEGWRRRLTWAANRPQQDMHFDVELLPGTTLDETGFRGERDPALVIERRRMAPLTAGVDRVELYRTALAPRVGPDGAGAPGDVERVRLIYPGAQGSLQLDRIDAALRRLVQRFPRGVRSRIGVPQDGGATGWGRKARRGR